MHLQIEQRRAAAPVIGGIGEAVYGDRKTAGPRGFDDRDRSAADRIFGITG